jgi:hypothetical protein
LYVIHHVNVCRTEDEEEAAAAGGGGGVEYEKEKCLPEKKVNEKKIESDFPDF